jgi:hypothetical protein
MHEPMLEPFRETDFMRFMGISSSSDARRNGVYRWLKNQPACNELLRRYDAKFATKQRRLEFLKFLAWHVMSAYSCDRLREDGRHLVWRGDFPSAAWRKKADGHVNALLSLLQQEVAPRERIFFDLFACLATYARARPQKGRKPREDAKAIELFPVREFAIHLRSRFGIRDSAMVVAFAALVGIECDPRTAQRYSKLTGSADSYTPIYSVYLPR